jgi:hypothetical protein
VIELKGACSVQFVQRANTMGGGALQGGVWGDNRKCVVLWLGLGKGINGNVKGLRSVE